MKFEEKMEVPKGQFRIKTSIAIESGKREPYFLLALDLGKDIAFSLFACNAACTKFVGGLAHGITLAEVEGFFIQFANECKTQKITAPHIKVDITGGTEGDAVSLQYVDALLQKFLKICGKDTKTQEKKDGVYFDGPNLKLLLVDANFCEKYHPNSIAFAVHSSLSFSAEPEEAIERPLSSPTKRPRSTEREEASKFRKVMPFPDPNRYR